MTYIANTEHVARLLKPIWVSKGVVAPVAFTLRSRLHETYISVLCESASTFEEDARRIAHSTDKLQYASFLVEELSSRKDFFNEDEISYSVKTTDNETIKSHAGIFIAVNGVNVVGGEPFDSFSKKKGISEEAILIDISKKLAMVAQKDIKSL